MKRLIIYDLDGTLVDSGEDIAQAANAMLRALAPDQQRTLEEIREMVGQGLHDLVGRCLGTSDPARIEAGVRHFGEYYGQHLTDHTRLYPGATDVLEHFRHRTQVIVTNKPNPFARDLVQALGVAKFFSAVIASNSTYPKKPDPTSVLAMIRNTGVTPLETLLIGDSPIDIETGRNAGVLTVVLTHGFSDEQVLRAAKPDLAVKNFQELLRTVQTNHW